MADPGNSDSERGGGLKSENSMTSKTKVNALGFWYAILTNKDLWQAL